MATSNEFERDEDRLPWLETVEPDEPHGSGAGRKLLLALVGVLVLGAAIFGLYRLQVGSGAGGSGELIAAQEGDYKVKPDDPGGLKVEGEGDTAPEAVSLGVPDADAAPDTESEGVAVDDVLLPPEGVPVGLLDSEALADPEGVAVDEREARGL